MCRNFKWFGVSFVRSYRISSSMLSYNISLSLTQTGASLRTKHLLLSTDKNNFDLTILGRVPCLRSGFGENTFSCSQKYLGHCFCLLTLAVRLFRFSINSKPEVGFTHSCKHTTLKRITTLSRMHKTQPQFIIIIFFFYWITSVNLLVINTYRSGFPLRRYCQGQNRFL